MIITQVPAHPSNFATGRAHQPILAIVLHVMDGTLTGTDAWFQKHRPINPTSTHYGIGLSGAIHQYVQDSDRAFHAGSVSFNATALLVHQQTASPNFWSIGIEHEGTSTTPWPDEMYAASAWLIHQLSQKYSIPVDPDHLIFHREIFTSKSCPGLCDRPKLISLVQALAA
jgi:N-acetyl-anhydromuramyl-L-alanine amidase AmpD